MMKYNMEFSDSASVITVYAGRSTPRRFLQISNRNDGASLLLCGIVAFSMCFKVSDNESGGCLCCLHCLMWDTSKGNLLEGTFITFI